MVRYRWSDGPNDFAAPTPRPGAVLRSPIINDVGRVRTYDLAQPRLLAKLGQDGSTGEWTGEWMGENGESRPMRVENGPRGLELWLDPEEETVDGLRRRVAPRQVHDRPQDPYDAVRAYQKLLDKTYAK